MSKKSTPKKRRVHTSTLNRFGHKVGCISERIDRALLVENARQALTLEQIANKANCTVSRVRSHLQCLKFGKRNYGFGFKVILTKNGKAYMRASKADIKHYDLHAEKALAVIDNYEHAKND
jgi:hypothetical protein